jgi:hypothetical protein
MEARIGRGIYLRASLKACPVNTRIISAPSFWKTQEKPAPIRLSYPRPLPHLFAVLSELVESYTALQKNN